MIHEIGDINKLKFSENWTLRIKQAKPKNLQLLRIFLLCHTTPWMMHLFNFRLKLNYLWHPSALNYLWHPSARNFTTNTLLNYPRLTYVSKAHAHGL